MADRNLSIFNSVDQDSDSDIESLIGRSRGDATSLGSELDVLLPRKGELDNTNAYIHRILVKEKHPVLFLGESSTLSMTIAVALMRGSFDGIWSSSYQLKNPPRNIHRVQSAVRDHFTKTSAATPWNADTFSELVDDAVVRRLSLEIDATQLSRSTNANSTIPTSLIFFSFPRIVGSNNHGVFLEKIIQSAKAVQDKNGGILMIGLSKSPSYTVYQFDVVKYASQLGYQTFSDESFLKETCCAYGYVHRWIGQDHQTGSSIHRKVIDPSILHVFFLRPRIRNIENAHSIN